MTVGVALPVMITVHVGCGVLAVACGAGAMLTRKGSHRHRRFGRFHLAALTGLGVTAPVLAAVDWAHRWHLVVLGVMAFGVAAIGFAAIRLRPVRLGVHITGMGTGYIVMLTAFYVDNGPRLPLWNQLPVPVLWLIPAAVGVPVLIWALNRRRAPCAGMTDRCSAAGRVTTRPGVRGTRHLARRRGAGRCAH